MRCCFTLVQVQPQPDRKATFQVKVKECCAKPPAVHCGPLGPVHLPSDLPVASPLRIYTDNSLEIQHFHLCAEITILEMQCERLALYFLTFASCLCRFKSHAAASFKNG